MGLTFVYVGAFRAKVSTDAETKRTKTRLSFLLKVKNGRILPFLHCFGMFYKEQMVPEEDSNRSQNVAKLRET